MQAIPAAMVADLKSKVFAGRELRALVMTDGRRVTAELVRAAIDSELASKPGTPAKKRAAEIFADMMTREDFQEFLTTAAYQDID